MSAGKVYVAFQERSGHLGTVLRRIRFSQIRPAGDRCVKFAEGVRYGKSEGAGTETSAGSVLGSFFLEPSTDKRACVGCDRCTFIINAVRRIANVCEDPLMVSLATGWQYLSCATKEKQKWR